MSAAMQALRAENARLRDQIETQADTIARVNREAAKMAKDAKGRDARHAREIAALQAAIDRLVVDNLRLRAEARPLLTEAEDEAGTKSMEEIELRGQIN